MSLQDDQNRTVLPMFHDAFIKASWADFQIKGMQKNAANYVNKGISIGFEDLDVEQKRKKFFLRAEPLDRQLISLQVGDAIRSLRSALDYAVSAIYRSRGLNENHAYFPVGDTQANLDSAIRGGIEKSGLEKLASFFSDGITPTKVGNNAIWTLNQLDRTNKHRSLTVMATIVYGPAPNFDDGFINASNNWLSLHPGEKLERLVPLDANIEDHTDPDPKLEIEFGQSEILAGQKVLPTLESYHESVVDALVKTQQAFVAAYGS